MSICLDFRSPNPEFSLSFEDDGKTGYAYLYHKKDIVADLWLYNRCAAPDLSEWKNLDNAPFANCKEFVSEGAQITKLLSENDVMVTWETDDSGPVAYVYIFEDLFGYLGVGDKPGYARFALRDGPVARRMELENEESRQIV